MLPIDTVPSAVNSLHVVCTCLVRCAELDGANSKSISTKCAIAADANSKPS